MTERRVEDWLRQEYFDLLPQLRRITDELETEVKYHLLPISREIDKYERLVVTSRVKECESALDALRRRQEGGAFDPDRRDSYSIVSLPDLAGVRVLAFPRNRWEEADRLLHPHFGWISDPVPADEDSSVPLAFKYHGYLPVSRKVQAELQIVPMLTGLFWEIEHSTIYKPSPLLKGVAGSPQMRQRTTEILRAFRNFEEELERLIDAVR